MRTVAADTVLCANEISVKINRKPILENVTLTACSGDLLAVMGASGSGKTTLLSTIAGRQPISSGDITLSGLPFNKDLRRRLGFVLQQDIFFSRLTLWETLYFAASIQLPEDVSKQDKISRINEIVDMLDIRKCLHTIMGDMFLRGLSGGEKKRASIGCELLTDPDILLLDEPTSGLDSSTAYSIMKSIKQFAKTFNKTVIVAIHQPSSQIYHMFDSLLLLSNGRVSYFGGANAEPLQHFAKLGHVCEVNYNPADFYLEVLKSESNLTIESNDSASTNKLSPCQSVDLSVTSSKQNLVGIRYSTGTDVTLANTDVTSVPDSTRQRWPTSFTTQFKMLTWRSFKQSRGRILHIYDFLQYVILSAAIGGIFFQVSNDAGVFRDRMGFLYVLNVAWAFASSIDTVMATMAEKAVISKERSAGAYRLSAYFLALSLSELPLKLCIPTLMYTVVYWMAGINGVQEFFASWAIFMLSVLVAQGLGLLIGAAINDAMLALVTCNTTNIIALLLSGFISQSIPSWLTWAKYLSIIQYPLSAMSLVVLQDIPPISCNTTGVQTFPRCMKNAKSYVYAEDVLTDAGIDLPVHCYISSIVIIGVLLRIGAYVALRFKTNAPA